MTTLAVEVPDAEKVFVAGAFNGWRPDATPLTRSLNGRWSVDLDLPPGRHEFKFVIDGQWCCKPGCDGSHADCGECVPNPFGSVNRVIEVAAR